MASPHCPALLVRTAWASPATVTSPTVGSEGETLARLFLEPRVASRLALRLLPFLARTGLLQPLLGKRRRASSTASFQCQEAHDNFYHSLASDPLPIVGNAVKRTGLG